MNAAPSKQSAFLSLTALSEEALGQELFTLEAFEESWRKNQHGMFSNGARAFVIVQPSFSMPQAIGIGEREGECRIFVAQHHRTWLDERMENEPTDPACAEYCEAAISFALGERLRAIWRLTLLNITPDLLLPGCDGTTFEFATKVDGELLVREAWSPPQDTETGALVEVADAMRTYCWTGDRDGLAALERNTETLFARLTLPRH